MVFSKAVQLSRYLVGNTLKAGECAVDATAGNGNDTLFLAEITGAGGRVYAFDIQEEALGIVRNKINEYNIQNVVVIKDGHENIKQYVSRGVGAVMFNLGYLPGVDHAITTKADTTAAAVETAAGLIRSGGIITVVAYSGHPGGRREKEHVSERLKKIDRDVFSVLHCSFHNQVNDPPELFCIQKY